jgi:hypothetical protein
MNFYKKLGTKISERLNLIYLEGLEIYLTLKLIIFCSKEELN